MESFLNSERLRRNGYADGSATTMATLATPMSQYQISRERPSDFVRRAAATMATMATGHSLFRSRTRALPPTHFLFNNKKKKENAHTGEGKTRTLRKEDNVGGFFVAA